MLDLSILKKILKYGHSYKITGLYSLHIILQVVKYCDNQMK